MPPSSGYFDYNSQATSTINSGPTTPDGFTTPKSGQYGGNLSAPVMRKTVPPPVPKPFGLLTQESVKRYYNEVKDTAIFYDLELPYLCRFITENTIWSDMLYDPKTRELVTHMKYPTVKFADFDQELQDIVHDAWGTGAFPWERYGDWVDGQCATLVSELQYWLLYFIRFIGFGKCCYKGLIGYKRKCPDSDSALESIIRRLDKDGSPMTCSDHSDGSWSRDGMEKRETFKLAYANDFNVNTETIWELRGRATEAAFEKVLNVLEAQISAYKGDESVVELIVALVECRHGYIRKAAMRYDYNRSDIPEVFDYNGVFLKRCTPGMTEVERFRVYKNFFMERREDLKKLYNEQYIVYHLPRQTILYS